MYMTFGIRAKTMASANESACDRFIATGHEIMRTLEKMMPAMERTPMPPVPTPPLTSPLSPSRKRRLLFHSYLLHVIGRCHAFGGAKRGEGTMDCDIVAFLPRLLHPMAGKAPLLPHARCPRRQYLHKHRAALRLPHRRRQPPSTTC